MSIKVDHIDYHNDYFTGNPLWRITRARNRADSVKINKNLRWKGRRRNKYRCASLSEAAAINAGKITYLLMFFQSTPEWEAAIIAQPNRERHTKC